MPSFDITAKVDLQEVDNAVNQAKKEIGTRYDFRNTNSELELDTDKALISMATSDAMHLSSMTDILHTKLAKRGISILALQYGDIVKSSGNRVKQNASLVQGLEKEKAKEIVKIIKKMGIKVQAQIMDDQVRVTAKKRDHLQAVMAEMRESQAKLKVPLSYTNRRN